MVFCNKNLLFQLPELMVLATKTDGFNYQNDWFWRPKLTFLATKIDCFSYQNWF